MGRIFIGLVKCGAWGCFDEFNRLEEAVLSAVSFFLQTIQAALKSKVQSTELLGRTVNIDFNFFFFITLNPAGKGYGGRQKLPDNLKQLFRPVVFLRPDNELIAEVFHWTHDFFPDAKRPLDTYYDPIFLRLLSYELELRSTQVVFFHCSAQSSPKHVLQKLQQMCMVISTNTGRVYRPKDCERLVLYLKDLNLPKPDKWGTSQLIAFLQQVITYFFFYDDNLEWVGLEGVFFVASMSAGTARENRELDILMFKEVLDNIARVERTMTFFGGSLLLAGRSGVGRRTAVTLVTHMHNIEVFFSKVSRSYGLKQFKNDLKSVSTENKIK
ncbi:Cytoplasmic dynein 2 heavy chain 1 [Exaiptasia diaphana]|nr:Cytoplasmic dynein 2 heavy chain 1 [Exaiptasia diaphana]